MSTATIANIIVALALLVAAGRIYRRWCRRATVRDHIVRLTHERAEQARTSDAALLAPPGDPLTRDVTAHLVAYILDHPDIADRFACLDQAIREQQKGEL